MKIFFFENEIYVYVENRFVIRDVRHYIRGRKLCPPEIPKNLLKTSSILLLLSSWYFMHDKCENVDTSGVNE